MSAPPDSFSCSPRGKREERLFTSGRTRNEIYVVESHKARHAHVVHACVHTAQVRVEYGVVQVLGPLAWIIKVLNLVSHCGLIIILARPC